MLPMSQAVRKKGKAAENKETEVVEKIVSHSFVESGKTLKIIYDVNLKKQENQKSIAKFTTEEMKKRNMPMLIDYIEKIVKREEELKYMNEFTF